MKLNLIKIRKEAIHLSQTTELKRNSFLKNLSQELIVNKIMIVNANKIDINNAKENNYTKSFIERLVLDEQSIKKLISKLNQIIKLRSGVNRILKVNKMEDGIVIKKVSVPIGVIAIIYESRPEVTIDVASLCIKSGNAAILKGGSEALNTNTTLFKCIQNALKKSDLSKDTIQLISSNDRKITNFLLTQNNYIDLVIARGGYGLVSHVFEHSRIPVLVHASGGARIYIDKSADISIVKKIIINAKTSKPSACNSLDTIVIHKKIALKILSNLENNFKKKGVKIIKDIYDEEFLDLKVSIKIVNDVYEAVKFINNHSNKHSEGIIAQDKDVISTFTNAVDAAALFVNCSTRLHDGYVFGLGSEMGIATGKLHARGPVGLNELTSYKWKVYGNGNIRE